MGVKAIKKAITKLLKKGASDFSAFKPWTTSPGQSRNSPGSLKNSRSKIPARIRKSHTHAAIFTATSSGLSYCFHVLRAGFTAFMVEEGWSFLWFNKKQRWIETRISLFSICKPFSRSVFFVFFLNLSSIPPSLLCFSYFECLEIGNGWWFGGDGRSRVVDCQRFCRKGLGFGCLGLAGGEVALGCLKVEEERWRWLMELCSSLVQEGAYAADFSGIL